LRCWVTNSDASEDRSKNGKERRIKGFGLISLSFGKEGLFTVNGDFGVRSVRSVICDPD
jgi:hypothetical protein